ncbi:hypothetical protein [Symbioplanes lichenis]|uniref:hypothetical protein n=1 Tax=Symbioplanes lichenis TaxID=1629072 RepID=UPI0027392976|nr:hypothetical protein [Actinoplanes lichenis]
MTNPHHPAPAPETPRRGSRGGLPAVTLIVAVLALVVGVSAVIISALALSRSDDAVVTAEKANSRPLPAPAVSSPAVTETTEPPADEPTDETADEPAASGTPTDISPTAQFEVAYEGENLRIRSVNCNDLYRTGVDLDEPRILGEVDAELRYGGCDPGTILTGLPFAQVSGPDATPADCLETIRTDPGRSPIAPSRGMTLCFQTAQNQAAAEGIDQKLVFVTVNSVTTDNGTGILAVTVKAWKVPQ